jgi:hypothetical protein
MEKLYLYIIIILVMLIIGTTLGLVLGGVFTNKSESQPYPQGVDGPSNKI